MANKSFNDTYASMTLKLPTQSEQQELLQQELDYVKHKLEQASKTLAQKEQIIGSLELDLEHMIDQLVKFQQNRNHANSQSQWLATNGANQVA